MEHCSAQPSHYDQEAEHYDIFNEKNSVLINQLIGEILKRHNVTTVLDLACGTGSQVFWLVKEGFKAIGFDINSQMLRLAKDKAKEENLDIEFLKGDMRTTKAGKFDAVITIFNAVGHLTKADFEQAMLNINENLKDQGLYVFDIFNLNFFLEDNNITKLTIDWQKKSGNTTVREIQYSTINKDGILASYDIYHEQKDSDPPKISQSFQTLQIYSAAQLKAMLEKSGFEVLEQHGIDRSKLMDTQIERILTIARRI